jgi:adenylate kinase family enzyme
MKRIAIVGISGSGKSTLANKLSVKLGIPAIHLDKHFWTKDWVERYSRADFQKVAEDFAKTDSWIIDGNYRSSIDMRFERADVIIFLDYPKYKCIWRAFTRSFSKKAPFDKTEGAKEKFSFFLFRYILRYRTHEMRERVGKYINTKKVFIVKNDKEKWKLFDLLN